MLTVESLQRIGKSADNVISGAAETLTVAMADESLQAFFALIKYLNLKIEELGFKGVFIPLKRPLSNPPELSKSVQTPPASGLLSKTVLRVSGIPDSQIKVSASFPAFGW